jgi:hypothetical protein
VAAIAGRRFDKPDGPPRFPRSNDALVRRRIRDVLERRRVQTLVASAACGADLAALEIAEQLRIRRVVFLPHDPETFRERSVVDRAPDWGSRYDRVIEALRAAGDLHVLNAPGSGDAAYRATSDALLSETLKLAATSHVPAIAIVVWDGESRGPDDFTDHFRQSAAIRELPIEEVGTL